MKKIVVLMCLVLVVALSLCILQPISLQTETAVEMSMVKPTLNTKLYTPQVVKKFNVKNVSPMDSIEIVEDVVEEEIIIEEVVDNVSKVDNTLYLATKTVQFNGTTLNLESNDTGYTVVGYVGSPETLVLSNTSDNITEIGAMAFNNCQSLKSIDLSALTSLKKINYRAFDGCVNLSSISISSSVNSFGENAFTNTPWLENQRKIAPNGLVIINSVLIDGKAAVGDITLPNDLRSITNKAFAYNKGITSVSMNSITKIPMAAFYFATGLVSVDLKGVTSVGTEAFYGCSSLTTVSNLQDLSVISNQAFVNCKNLKNIDFNNSNISSIGRRAFANCTSIQSIIFPSTLNTIGVAAFYNCSGLESVSFAITDGLTVLPDGVFQNCTRLSVVENLDATLGVGVFLNTKFSN